LAVSPRLLGGLAAIVTLVADQANKLWLIFVFGIAAHQPVRVTPFFDIVYARNPGISYSLLSASTEFGRWALFAATFAATLLIGFWLWRARTKLVALGLGCIVGGALGNACDRLFYGAVADFYHFHLGSFSWYIFNLADCAIVAGVGLLLYDSLVPGLSHRSGETSGKPAIGEAATKSPRSEA
jgi:signal peptidase II